MQDMREMAKAAGQSFQSFTPPGGETQEQVRWMLYSTKNEIQANVCVFFPLKHLIRLDMRHSHLTCQEKCHKQKTKTRPELLEVLKKRC